MSLLADNIAVIATAVLIVAFLTILGLVAKRIRRVPPNQALIIVGKGAGKAAKDATDSQKVVIGGRVFVWPVLQEAFPVSLEQRQIGLVIEGVDKNFIAVAVKASVLFKVRGDEEGVRRAAQRFMSQQSNLEGPLKQALEGALRPILGSMTVEQIISDRQTLQNAVVTSIKEDLAEQGFQLDLVNLSDITTPGSDYLTNLGRAQAAAARQVAEVKEAEARLTSETAQIATAEQVALRQRDLALKQATIKAETDKAAAEADAAGQLARAQQQRIVAEQEREALVEQARVREQQLDIDVRKPAEAQAYAAAKQAEGERDAAQRAAEADAFTRTKLAEAEKIAATNQAEGIKALGLARAEAAKAEGLAAAEATKAQAEALKEQGEAVLAQQVIAVLPDVVRAAAEPISGIDNLTVVSTDGASAITKTVSQTVAEGTGIVKALAGVDLGSVLGGFLGAKSGDTTAS